MHTSVTGKINANCLDDARMDIAYPRDPLTEEKRARILKRLQDIVGETNVSDKEIDKIVYSRDYWPLALRWMLEGTLAACPDFIVWPTTSMQIADLLTLANAEEIPVIPFGEGSGVLGGAIPVKGGIMVDMKRMRQLINLDETNLTVTVQAGINGMTLERVLNREGYTMGHIPQSLYCSTLGGWLACRAAGQFSTKYGKIDDMVLALEAVLPQGEIIRSKAVPKTSTGPRIDRLLLGSEGTLGIMTEATLKIWPYPETRVLRSYGFPRFQAGLEAVRRILRKGVYPAVVRLYDEQETTRHFSQIQQARGTCMLILVMEGSSELVDLEVEIVHALCTAEEGVACGEAPAAHWLKTRFNVKEVSEFMPRDVVFDTIEVSVLWYKALPLYQAVTSAMRSIDGVILASAHASHCYPQGLGLYFTFGGIAVESEPRQFYQAVWEAAMKSCLAAGGSISHHHGIGIMRAAWLPTELGKAFSILKKIKNALDPLNIMNPGKMGL